jgi:HEAT repeat protein
MRTLLLLALFLQDADLDSLKTRFEIEKDKPSAQRIETLDAIASLKTDAAGELLIEIFDKDRDLGVQALALKGIADWGSPVGRKKLADVAGDRKRPPTFRAIALDALTHPPSPEGLPVAKAVAREPGEIRISAWNGLRQYPLKDTDFLWRDGLKDPDPLIRAMAMMSLAPLKEVVLQETARKALDPNADAEPLVKYASVTVLQTAAGVVSTRVFIGAAATPDPTLRRLLAEALGAATDDKSAAEIYAALRSPDPGVRAVMARALGKLKHASAGDRLSEPLKDKVLEVRAAALESVAERKEKSAEAILHREAQSSNEESAALAIALLPAFPSEATIQLLLKLAGHHKPGLAIPALEALGELHPSDSFAVFDKALKAKEWPVRVAAIRGLVKLRRKDSIDLLVDRIDKEEGRMLAEIVDALRGLTGKPFGYAPGQWKEWWAGAKEEFNLPDRATAIATSQAGMTTYHGVPVLSNRIVFLLDMSGSMSTETTGSETRMDQAKKELSRVLSQLNPAAQVNLIFFDDKIQPWSKGLLPLKTHLKDAQAVVAKVAPRGQTNIFDSLDFAFTQKEADTIYLLSDGDPTAGRIIDPDDILREIRRMNRLRQIVIHTISFGASPFLKRLAEQNGGQYVEIK